MSKDEKKNPHRMQAIAWRDGKEKEMVVKCLNKGSVTRYQPSGIIGNAGKQVLWAARKIRELADAGKLEETNDLFGKPVEVEALEARIADLEEKLKAAQGGEVSYVDTINSQQHLLSLYRHIADVSGFVVDEEQLRYRNKADMIWRSPGQC